MPLLLLAASDQLSPASRVLLGLMFSPSCYVRTVAHSPTFGAARPMPRRPPALEPPSNPGRVHGGQVIWITTVVKDGTPQPNPVGFLFQDDNSILIYVMVNANRISHVVDRLQVALHFDGDGSGGDIVILTDTVCRADGPPPATR